MSAPTHRTWGEAVELLAGQSGTALLVGAVDTGKSTLALAAANEAVRRGRQPAILDTDLGQGELGPPGTLAVVRLEEPVASLAQLRPRALAFVGATSAPGHMLQVIQGSCRLVRHARSRGDEVVYVDTSGLVHGRLAERLKLAKLAVLEPELVVVLERESELERLAGLLATGGGAQVVRVRSAPEIRRKTALYRKLERQNRFRRHLAQGRIVDLDAAQVQTVDAWLYSGRALPQRQLRVAAEALGIEVLHGEETADGIYLCANGRPNREGFAELMAEFGRRRVVVSPAVAFRSLLVGLVEEGGRLADIGLLQGVNFERALMSIYTPARDISAVRQVHFGRLRVRADGSEIVQLKPGDL